MRTGGAMLLVVVGLVVLWIVVTGRLDRLVAAWGTLQGTASTDTTGSTTAAPINYLTPGTSAAPSVSDYVSSFSGTPPAMAIRGAAPRATTIWRAV